MTFEEFYNIIDDKTKEEINKNLDNIQVKFSLKSFNNFDIVLQTQFGAKKKTRKHLVVTIDYSKAKKEKSNIFRDIIAYSAEMFLSSFKFKNDKEVLKKVYEQLFLEEYNQKYFIITLFARS